MPEQSGAGQVAVVGIGCRVPGAESPEELWALLSEGRDAVTAVPEDRTRFASAVRSAGERGTGAGWGGFLTDIGAWDPGFFGVSPAEAAATDPQQALALEVAWRALENAGVPRGDLAGSRTGVFFGQATHDHAVLLGDGPVSALNGPYTNPGLSHAITANRMSYLWDLRGPSLAVDTACSSSLVAVHLAVQSLLSEECDRAIAGGVNAMLSPVPQLGAAGLTALAPDGRCRTFDSAGRGYVRSEGAGAVILRRLDDALAAGEHIHAVISGTGVNQDGRTNGLTAPSGRAQTELLTQSLRRAGILAAEELGYAELHGTGTPLGDPIEARALANALSEVLGEDRPALPVGSVKANIGHLEAAAGIVGLIRTALILGHGRIPGNPHLREVNPRIDLDAFRLRISPESLPWPVDARAASVSSFGFGGTNASVILSRTPSRSPRTDGVRVPAGPVVLPLSARNPEALAGTAALWTDRVRSAADWEEVGHLVRAAAAHRTPFECRVGIVASDAAELAESLEEAAGGREFTHALPTDAARLGFVYSGHGSQWEGMGRELLRTSPAFARRVQEADEVLAPLLGWSPLAALRQELPVDLDDISVIQPLILTVQLALTEELAELGIHPDAVAGHSMGELGAAVVASRIGLATAGRVLRARNEAVEVVRGKGGMAVVEASAEEAREVLLGIGSPVTVAADNSPRACLVTGTTEELARVEAEFEARGQDTRRVKVDYPSHGPLMREPVELMAAALGRLPAPPTREDTSPRFYSAVYGKAFDGVLDTGYWKENLTAPVRAREVVAAMAEDGITHFLEISPHPVLLVALREVLQEGGHRAVALPTGHRKRPSGHGLLPVAAELFEHGGGPVTEPDPVTRALAPTLPGHPFRRQPVYHLHTGPAQRTQRRTVPGTLTETGFQPGTFLTEVTLPEARAEHRVAGREAVSAAELIALACWAAEQAGLDGPCAVRNLEMSRTLPADPATPLQLALVRGGDPLREPGPPALVTFYFRNESGQWLRAASCTVARDTGESVPMAATDLVQVKVAATERGTGPATTPGLLDPALPAAAEALFGDPASLADVLVSHIGSARVLPRLWSAQEANVACRLRRDGEELHIDLDLVDSSGELLAQIHHITLQHLSRSPGAPPDAPLAGTETVDGSAPSGRHPLRQQLARLGDVPERRTTLGAWVRSALGAILPGGFPDGGTEEMPFTSLGLESLMGVELRNRLEAELGLRLSVALVWAHPTIHQLCDALLEVLDAEEAPTAQQADGSAQRQASVSEGPAAAPDALAQLLAELDSPEGAS
ncbi:Beta-ketoacyl synthase [Streptomyces albus]|uniref:Beta-ketoacyl synthase n=1 Tax=Streptomyces albus (strain ATCC 21838 / DSM 41398 / FERM P-419 / JCM 4703 / NBRC 107858) TaxID=1081613 RepID=A0A0B5EX46_STRA4|nr:Beta-ketoacyl synthase [Streptomyces albus]AOU81671.1 Beta-ketoacyl synthase [Streptomyces albus]AYN37360.1 type I polyketide synthase [Streptomyces albus]